MKKGEFVAFVGKSGSGKSTAAKILSGIYKNYDGSILLNGTELSEMNSSSIFDFVTYISHRDWIFAGSVRDCLLEGKENASQNEMIEVLKKVRLWDFLNENGGDDIDIIAKDETGTVVFVEVKTRRNRVFGEPEEAIDYRKMQSLQMAINHYLKYRHINGEVRFDIISIVGTTDSEPEINHIKDVSLI